MASFGASYNEFLEAAATPGLVKFTKRYNGRPAPAPVLKSDTELIRKHLDEAVVNGLGEASAKTSASYLCAVSRQFPDFRKMDTHRAGAAFSALRVGMKPNSARRAMQILRMFLRWMNDEKINTNIDLKKIQKIKPPKQSYDTKQASNMLTGKEISLLIETAENDRDKALIAMIFEGSLRPIEAVEARWGDLNFDKYGAQFTTSKKTGIPRYIRLIMSAPYLLKWKNIYPGRATNDSHIFVSLNIPHGPIKRPTIKSTFDVLLKKSGITKKVTPYYLRHSRITSMIADEIPDSVVKLQAWGSLRSNMLSTYAHLQNHDVDRILLGRAGVITESETVKDESLKPRQCSFCGKIHTPTTRFCDECGKPLTDEARVSQVDAVQAADDGMLGNAKDPVFIDAVARRMLELQREKQ